MKDRTPRVSAAPATALHWELTAAGIENLGRDGAPTGYAVEPPGPGELLARVDACGICFSDIKILNLGSEHPRLRGRDLRRDPVVMGHEVALTVIAAGPEVRAALRPGDRVIAQADVYYRGQGMAIGYRLPGGFSQYVRVGREILEGDEGCYLLPIPEHLGYSEAALCEPWACVEASYRYEPRRGPRRGGALLILVEDPAFGPVAWPPVETRAITLLCPQAMGDGEQAAARWMPAGAARAGGASGAVAPQLVIGGSPVERFLAESRSAGTRFDDIIVLGPAAPATLEALLPLLARGGFLNLVGAAPAEQVAVDVGRIHYEDVGLIGTMSRDVARAYAESREAELTPGGVAWFIGAGGPIGRMHLQRVLGLAHPPRKMVVTQNTGPRFDDLRERFAAPARERGIAFTLLDPKGMAAEELVERLWRETKGAGFDDVVCMVPSVPSIEIAAGLLAPGGGVNIFAGLPVGTMASLDLRPIVERRVRYWGTSGSTIADLRATAEKLAASALAPNRVVAAVGGIGSVREGLAAVRAGRFLGKTVIYPQLEQLPLLSIAEVAARYPSVGECLTDGQYWNREAEAELFRVAG